MLEKLRAVLLFDISQIRSLQNVREEIMTDNRRFAVIWALAQLFYATYSLIMSFWQSSYMLCRGVYVGSIVVSILAFVIAEFFVKGKPLLVYLTMLLNEIGLFGAGLLIAWILLRNGGMTIMVFAAALIVPTMFVNNTLLNILTAVFDIICATILLKHGLPPDVYGWCVSNLIIFSSMGVLLGHFVNKARFERYVFAESAVQLAESNAKLAELQTWYAYHDQMTELKNRRAFSEKINSLSKEFPETCCVIMVDINALKKTNDLHGHAAGDELIVGTALCLRRSFEGIETIYRVGGDEFCVITDDLEEAVKKRLTKLERECADWKGTYISGISISYGYASTAEFADMDSILKEADVRMYARKNQYYERSAQTEKTDRAICVPEHGLIR